MGLKAILKLVGFIGFLFFLNLGSKTFAQTEDAILALNAASSTLQKDEIFLVQVFLTAPQPVNTVRLLIEYSTDKLSLQDLSFNYSNFSNIVERNTSLPGQIDLTAFTNTAYQGVRGLVTTLKFKAKEEGEAFVSLKPESKVHLADGRGTNVFNYQASVKSLAFVIGGAAPILPNQPSSIPTASSQEETSQQTAQNTAPKSFLGRLIDFLNLTPSKPKGVGQTQTQEKIFFPEMGVVDLSSQPQSRVERFIHQYPVIKKASYLFGAFIVFIFGLYWYLRHLRKS